MSGMYTELFSRWGGGGRGGGGGVRNFLYVHIVLFLFSDVEHSCLPGSLYFI